MKEAIVINTIEFVALKNQFEKADVEGKIELYVNSEDLTQEQYRALLKMFPTGDIEKLEMALNAL